MAGFNKKYNKEIRLNERNKSQLLAYDFPGNIRELRNLMERLVVTASSSTAEHAVRDPMWDSFKDASKDAGANTAGNEATDESDAVSIDKTLKEAVREYELAYIRKAIEVCGGNITKASELLGVHRTSIYKKMPEIEE